MCNRSWLLVVAVVGMLVACLMASLTLYAAPEIMELSRLAEAVGQDYVQQRNTMLEKMTTDWDIQQVATRDWDAGLAAYVLNARFRCGKEFLEWDNYQIRLYPSGRVDPHPALRNSDVGPVFLVEQLWKDRLPLEFQPYAIRAIMAKPSKAPLALWTAVYFGSTNAALRCIAAFAMASDETPAGQERSNSILSGSGLHAVKSAVLRGIEIYRPRYAVDMLIRLIGSASNDVALAESALHILGKISNSKAREFVRRVALDTGQSERLRTSSIVALGNRPEPGDVPYYVTLLKSVAADRTKDRVVSNLQDYPYAEVASLVFNILATSTNEAWVNWSLDAVEKASTGHTQQVINQIEALLIRRNNFSPATQRRIVRVLDELKAKETL